MSERNANRERSPPSRVPPASASTFRHRHDGQRRMASRLARKISRSQSFVSKFERGEYRLNVIEFLEVARALSLDPARLITDIDRR